MSKLKAKWLEGSVGTPDFQKEVPTGTVDGVNVTFTLSYPFTEMISLTLNSRELKESEYSVTGSTITLTFAPALGQELYAIYY